MAQSPEYPDLRWVESKSWTDANRTSVQLIVIHTTEGHEEADSAEDGAAYDARRTDGTSTHYFHDRNSTVQCVRTSDQAHAARTQGNRRGIQHELCGKAGQGATGWADDASQGTLRQAAKQAARDAKKWNIPIRHLTVAQVAAGTKGFCGHWDITRAFPQDDGTHTDPGTSFPWTQFLDMVRDELDILNGVNVTSPAEVWAQDIDSSAGSYSASGALWTVLNRTGALNAMPTSLAQLKDTLDDLVADQGTDIDALGATLAFISGQLGLLLAPPSEDHPVVKAVRFAMVNPGE